MVENCPAEGFACVDLLEQRYRSEKLPFGRGMFVYGCRGTTVLVENRQVEESAPRRRACRSLTRRRCATSCCRASPIACPRWCTGLQPRVLRKGRRFQASTYGFCYYQRSYDRAFDWLSSQRMSSRVMRAAGVDPRLTVCHQTFAIPPDRVHRFLNLYFERAGPPPASRSAPRAARLDSPAGLPLASTRGLRARRWQLPFYRQLQRAAGPRELPTSSALLARRERARISQSSASRSCS